MLLPAEATPRRGAWLLPIGVALAVTALVAAASWLLPPKIAGSAVGLVFVGATWQLVLRRSDAEVRAHGLSISGFLSGEPVSVARVARDLGRAVGITALLLLVVIPPFAIGYPLWWSRVLGHPLLWQGRPVAFPPGFLEEVVGQVFTIALPEEAFYRGYLQSELDRAWRPRVRFLGASIGPAILVTSVVFALGHVVTEPHPNRLAVFFPSLAFGFLRARTGGVGTSIAFHAACNLASVLLGFNFGVLRR